MRLRCEEGRYCNPQFTLETGHISPDLTDAIANQILNDFPDQFSEATDEEYAEWCGTLEEETKAKSESSADAVVAAEEERIKNSDESTRREMIVHLKDKGFKDNQIAKFMKDKTEAVEEEEEEEEAEEEGPEAPESEEAATKPADRQVKNNMRNKRGGRAKKSAKKKRR